MRFIKTFTGNFLARFRKEENNMKSSIGYKPKGKWTFDESVVNCFDDMLIRSIPQYVTMRESVRQIALRYARRKTTIVDLGCSTGGSIAKLIDHLPENRFVGLENSEPMIAEAKRRFERYPNVNILSHDLRDGLPPFLWNEDVSTVLSVLTLQFVPVEYRQQLIKQIYEILQPGGIFLFVEKIVGSNDEIKDLFIDLYHEMKRSNGYSEEEIEAKQKSLEGVLVPLGARTNEKLLEEAGFRFDCFWRLWNFAGWIAIK